MSQFQSIQELYSFEGSEASPMIADVVQPSNGLLLSQLSKKDQDRPLSPIEDLPSEESPIIDQTGDFTEMEAAIKSNNRDIKEALLVYKQLKDCDFFKSFKKKFRKDLRTTEALISLCKVMKYEYHLPKTFVYTRGDLSNQKVYIVYSGEVETWVGKPEAYALAKGKTNGESEKKERSNVTLQDFSLFAEGNSFERQSPNANQTKNKLAKKLHQMGSMNMSRGDYSSGKKPDRGLKKQFTFDGVLSSDNCVVDMSTLEQLPETNSKEELNLDEILDFKTPSKPRLLSSESSGVHPKTKYFLSQRKLTKSPQPHFLDNSLDKNLKFSPIRNESDSFSFGGHETPPKPSLNGLQRTTSNRSKEELENDNSFVLRKIQSQRSRNLDCSLEKRPSEGGYVKGTVRCGGHFGDEALASNQPRKETLVATTACELLSFSVDDYEYLMTRFEKNNTQILDFLLDYVPGLEEAINRNKIRNPESYFEEQSYNLHNHITIEGTKGSKLYMLYEGTCKVLKSVNGPVKDQAFRKPYSSSNNEVVICVIKPGVFIGEEVMFNQNGEYEYTVKAASSRVKVLAIESLSFKDAMPKLAYSGLESLNMNKKQKNMQIMNYKVEFSKGLSRFPKLTTPRSGAAEPQKEEEPSILNKVDTPLQEQKHVKLGVPIENKRFSRVKKLTPSNYTVEVALPTAQGPQLLDGMKYMRTTPFKTQDSFESNSYQMQTNTSVEREEEDKPKLTENEKKLKRYLNKVRVVKKEEPIVKPFVGKPLEILSLQRLQQPEPPAGNGRESRTQNTSTNEFDKYRMMSKGVKKELRMPSSTRGTEKSTSRKKYDGMSTKRLDELFSYIVPNREKFIGFMSQDKQKNNIYSFSKYVPSSTSRDFSNIKVDVDTNTKRITYGIGSVRLGQHVSSKSQSGDQNLASVNNTNTFLNVKTAALSKIVKSPRGGAQQKNSARRSTSVRPETEPVQTLGQFLDSELRPPVNIMPKLKK